MNDHLRTITIRFAGLVLLILLMPTGVFSQNGKMVDTDYVKLTGDDLKQFGPSEQRVRAILEQVELRKITYLSDGLKVKAYLAYPKKGEKLPCVIYNRGGNREFGALTDARAVSTLGLVASWGYVVVASQYRGNAGGEGMEEFGGRDVNDVLNLIPLLESLPQADAARIGMYGWSRGGMMTYLALARTDRIAAAVVGAGAADLFEGAKRRPKMETEVYAHLIPDYHKSKDRELTACSAVRWPERLHKKTPILLLHGSAD